MWIRSGRRLSRSPSQSRLPSWPAALIVISAGRFYFGKQIFIGRLFAIVIVGLGSLPGTLIAGLLFGVIEDMTSTLLRSLLVASRRFRSAARLNLALRPRDLLGAAGK